MSETFIMIITQDNNDDNGELGGTKLCFLFQSNENGLWWNDRDGEKSLKNYLIAKK